MFLHQKRMFTWGSPRADMTIKNHCSLFFAGEGVGKWVEGGVSGEKEGERKAGRIRIRKG